ncbi:MAG: hypothetical protein H0W74_02335 [Sphingosinicella sp.]|nr:hypothetical protein [Sphingosinicella sp.]
MQADKAGDRPARVKRRSGRKSDGGRAFLQARSTAKGVAIVMALLAIGYAAVGAASFYGQIGGYSDVPMGATGDEVQYFAGKPSLIRANDRGSFGSYQKLTADGQWLYRREGCLAMSVSLTGVSPAFPAQVRTARRRSG